MDKHTKKALAAWDEIYETVRLMGLFDDSADPTDEQTLFTKKLDELFWSAASIRWTPKQIELIGDLIGLAGDIVGSRATR